MKAAANGDLAKVEDILKRPDVDVSRAATNECYHSQLFYRLVVLPIKCQKIVKKNVD